MVVSGSSEQPVSYLPPLLTNILLSSDFTCGSSSSGVRRSSLSSHYPRTELSSSGYMCVSPCRGVHQPLAVLLCPGWEKVLLLSELLEEMQVNHRLHATAVLLGLGEDEVQAFRIPKNCESRPPPPPPLLAVG